MSSTETPSAPATLVRKSLSNNGVHVWSHREAPWVPTDRPGLRTKAVRRENATGHYLGYISMDPMTSTGLHQHLGPATSLFLQGSLWDFQGVARTGCFGINLKGATHDAIAYEPTLIVSRLDGGVIYPGGASSSNAIHSGARDGQIANLHPERLPDINIEVDAVTPVPTAVAGVLRRDLYRFDEPQVHCAAMTVLPGTQIPDLVTTGRIDLFVWAGAIECNGDSATSGDFVTWDADARIQASSAFGCALLVWAEGSARGASFHDRDLVGFA